MANYYGYSRTNYFRVTDEDKYAELFSRLVAEDCIKDFTDKDENGNLIHGFGSYSPIEYLDEDDYYNIDWFCEQLKEILPDDEAFIYQEVGYEKLRYLVGVACVVTNKGYRWVDLKEETIKTARNLLGNPNWETQMEY